MLRKTTEKCQRLWNEFQRREDGQVAVMFAFAVLPLVTVVGAAVDYSRGNQVRTSLQKALDSSVLAAAIDGSSSWRTAALNSFNGNVNAKGSSVGMPTFTLEKDIYSGSVSASTETSFMGVVGIHSLAISAKSAATTAKSPLCVLGLNAFDTGAFDMNGNSKFNAPTCAVQVNTKANKGMTQEGQPTAVAKRFGVSGAQTGNGYSTPPKDGSPAVPDPYASIPFPSHDTCSKGKGLTINGGSTTLSPGTYCG